ncbi:MAG: hypothetical protein AAF602_03435 [Myxococcota bacterium]
MIRFWILAAWAVAAGLGGGCAAECLDTDPRCDVAWPGGRLTVVAPFASSLVETTDEDATIGIWRGRGDGFVDHGTDWSADAIEESLVIGVPDADGVFVEPFGEPGVLGAAPILTGESRFGDIVRAVPQYGKRTLFVGAPGADLDRGALYRFPRIAEVLDLDPEGAEPVDDPADPAAPDLVILGETPNDRLGANVEVCGDIDGDGWLDLVLGVPNFQARDACGMADEPPPNLAGAVFVLRSSQLENASGEVSICDIEADVLWGTEVGEQAGTSVACGPDAIYVGAPWHGQHGDDDQNAGVVYRVPLTALPADGPLPTLATSIAGPAAEAGFGFATATLSLSGNSALLVGAPGYSASPEGARRGLVELFVEEETGIRSIAAVAGIADGDQFGRTVLAADLDDDGADDVVLGSPDVVIDGSLDVGRLWLWTSDAVITWSGEIDRGSAEQVIEGTHGFQRVGRKLSRTTVQERSVLLVPTRAVPATR